LLKHYNPLSVGPGRPGKQLQKQLGMAGLVADYYIRQNAKRILESKPRKKGKPN
jgi:hypothetical protein